MKNTILLLLVFAVIVLGVLFVRKSPHFDGDKGGGRQTRPDENNLTHVKCNSKNPNNPGNLVEIPVNDSNGLDDPYKMIFVCKNETVHWKIADPRNTVTVTFTGVWPFKPPIPPGQMLTSDPITGVTPDQTVKIVTGYEVDEYALVVKKPGGATVKADPHIIPMGP